MLASHMRDFVLRLLATLKSCEISMCGRYGSDVSVMSRNSRSMKSARVAVVGLKREHFGIMKKFTEVCDTGHIARLLAACCS